MHKVAICGASGYTGAELLRILLLHPDVEITAVTSERSAGKSLPEVFPHLTAYKHLIYEPLESEKILSKADIFFMALPHGASQIAVDYFFSRGKKVIDLSADYRIKDPSVYEQWYKLPHQKQDTLAKAVYGLPELFRNDIKDAQLIANPGCYPTGSILALAPVLKGALVDEGNIIIDAKSGVSGAGRKSDLAFSYCEVNDGFKAYGLGTHRHTPEIEQILSSIAGSKIVLNFTPHLVPMDRGIITTAYCRLKKRITTQDLLALYNQIYAEEEFVVVLPEGKYPDAKHVRGTNYCHIGLKVDNRTNTLIAVSAIDNLVKGASGQAVQNMNLMLGINESVAIRSLALYP
ncbi:MAG: N-acetyl-gamma-glutamyl-phosphate reductase [Dissulfurispiraceae bacterium]|jgi:N-acetyl-gamma-glutamyl-phosphate reductase|nr:N-acetyl-gamma-glutamyl-phosphate reductase [Dissulfurispiraceae bacterium]